ncbi:MAG: hypothetical protein KatS3mg073_1730 [Meiothermus sp.]|jgi:hypothetical protein|uniref:Uncharacterized protein n=1 Tax=Meiothermus hypogaeus TaxID=884155 RepID=A0ABX9MTL8_9DEIN|nr:hypothetical protein Mhypo_00690 [Meiothermus hypogaeus]GIW36862.1 MAG: hypothetical protein KatS3mg073_1007 [Meiothermus sp.]GIW37585.1 MAG: hypothetical protein KatS3mg073_1730 [Meiothermus sp.]
MEEFENVIQLQAMQSLEEEDYGDWDFCDHTCSISCGHTSSYLA